MDKKVIIRIGYGSTTGIVRKALDRIEHETGIRPEDWMDECHDNAVIDATDEDGCFDWDMFESQIDNDADNYIDFMKENYPDEVRAAKEVTS